MNDSPASVQAGENPSPATMAPPDNAFGRQHWIALLLSLFICAVYTFYRLGVGWIPTDDGTLAQSAARVLHGQVPHRDFVEIYTGGLSFYHALAFRLFGLKLIALRYAVFAIFLPAMAAVYYLASRFASPIVAAAVTLLCAAWSLPAYPAAMPSWYNLFFALLGAAAIFRHIETPRWWWLLLAGLCAGLSIDVKITGLYFVAAALLLFVYREQQLTGEHNQELSVYRWFASLGLAAFVALLFWLMHTRLGDGEILHFILPATSIAVLLLIEEWNRPAGDDLVRFRTLFAMAIPFLAGVLLPVLLLLIPYWRAHSVHELYQGVFVGGSGTAASLGFVRPAGVLYLVMVAPLAALVALGLWMKRSLPAIWYILIAIAGVAVVVGACLSVPFAVNPWMSAATATPVIVIFGAWMMWRGDGSAWAELGPSQRRQQTLLLLALAAVCSLVQFPFAAPIYFHYFAPLPALALLAVVAARRRHACDVVLAEVLGFYLLLGVFYVVPATIYNYGLGLELKTAPLAVPAGEGLRVVSADQYIAISRAIAQIDRGETLLAFPECPEFYFLTGRRNPTRADSYAIPDEVERAMQDPNLRVIVINRRPVFPSSIPPQPLLEKVVAQFPNAAQVGQYQVRWR